MLVDDFGRDLAGIQALQRKQEVAEKDMSALFQQIQVTVCVCTWCNLQSYSDTLCLVHVVMLFYIVTACAYVPSFIAWLFRFLPRDAL